MAAITTGTTCIYGIAGTVSNLFVQSYSISSSFNSEATVVDEDGLTKTARYDNRKSEITIEGIAKTTSIPTLGATLSFTVNTLSAYPAGSASASFVGTITKVDDRGSNQGFTSVSITAVDYEGITPA
jgi:hypothetical protein